MRILRWAGACGRSHESDAACRLLQSSLAMQADINAFSKLNSSYHELQDELKVSKVQHPHSPHCRQGQHGSSKLASDGE